MYDLLVASVWSRVILDFFAHLRGRGRANNSATRRCNCGRDGVDTLTTMNPAVSLHSNSLRRSLHEVKFSQRTSKPRAPPPVPLGRRAVMHALQVPMS